MVAHKSSESAALAPAAASADHVADAGDKGLANPHHTRAKLQADTYHGREAALRPSSDNTAGAALAPMQITEGALSPKKSLDDLSKAGVIADKAQPIAAMRDASKPEPRPITSFEKPKIEVGFADTLEQQGKKPDLVVKADGKVEMLNNPERFSNGNITVAMERVPGTTAPTDAQQQSVTALYKYLDTRLKEQNPALAQKGVDLENPQGLVPEKVAAAQRGGRPGNNAPDGADAGAIQGGNRFSGSRSGGHLDAGQVGDMFPGRDFKSRNGKVDSAELVKDTVSSLNGSRGNHEFVGYRRDRGAAVGAYGMTADQFQSWLSNVDIADLEEKERKGLVPPGTAAKMKHMKEQLAKGETPDVLKKMKEAPQGQLSDADKKEITGTFGKEVQELAATDLIKGYSKSISEANGGKEVDPGQLALAMHLGRVPNSTDMADASNMDYMSAARNKFQLAAGATLNGGQGFDWNGDGNSIVTASHNADGQVKWQRFASVVQGGNLGCAASVSQVLREAGVNVTPDAGAHSLAIQLQQKGGERIPISQARPGDVIYGGARGASGGGSAHIGIVESIKGGQLYVGANSSSRGTWRSDQPMMNAFGRFLRSGNSELYAIRLPGKTNNA